MRPYGPRSIGEGLARKPVQIAAVSSESIGFDDVPNISRTDSKPSHKENADALGNRIE